MCEMAGENNGAEDTQVQVGLRWGSLSVGRQAWLLPCLLVVLSLGYIKRGCVERDFLLTNVAGKTGDVPSPEVES